MPISQTSLSAAADDRKARLAKLKNLKRKQPGDEIVPPESDRHASPAAAAAAAAEEEEEKEADNKKGRAEREMELAEVPDVARIHLSGRNYDPEVRGPKLGFEAPPTQDLEKPTLEEQAAEIEVEARQRAAEEERQGDRGIDLFKLQPKKPNWDLKRDLEKKLEVLNARTDSAIARLVRERIANAQKAAVAAGGESKRIDAGSADGDASGVDGIALVEGLRVREREEEEDERREKEADEELVV